MILISETVIGLQTQLNNLFSAASRLQLQINMNKSNIVVFGKGGYLGARERWVYEDCMMKVVNSYKYLGICFSTRLSFYHACQDLVSRAKRALPCIMSKLCRTDCNSIKVFFWRVVMLKCNLSFSMEQRYGVWKVAHRWLILIMYIVWFETLFRCGQENPKWSCVWRSWKVSYSN